MRKYVLILIGLILAALVAGCGGGNHSSKVINAAKTVSFVTTDISGTYGYSVTKDGYRGLTFNTDGTATWSDVTTSGNPGQTNSGTWSITADGALQILDSSSSVVFSFMRQQSETSYWFVYDSADTSYPMSRFYHDTNQSTAYSNASAYYYASSSTTSLYIDTINGLYRMGGAIQGGTSTVLSTSSTVALYAGYATDDPTNTGKADGSAIGGATFNQPFDITTDGTNYYVVDYVNSLIRQITKAGVVTTWTLKNSSETTVTLYHPEGITTDGTYLYVADTGHNVIRSIRIVANPDSSHTTTIIAGSTSYGSGSADSSTGTGAGFNNPTGITTDGTNLYVVDSYNHTIRKIVISSHAVSTLAGKAGKSGSANGAFTAARFYEPARITTDGTNLYITDTMNSIIRSIKIATGVVSTIAGDISKIGHTDGDGTAAVFYYPFGISTDGTNLYVTDLQGPVSTSGKITQNFYNLIRKIVIASPSTVTTIAGGEVNDVTYQDIASVGTGTTARFATPHGIIWDGSQAGLLVTNGTYIVKASEGEFDISKSVYNCIFSIK